MKQTLIAFVRDLEALCARMNGVLRAVAIVLSLVVVALGIVRAQQSVPPPTDGAGSCYALDL